MKFVSFSSFITMRKDLLILLIAMVSQLDCGCKADELQSINETGYLTYCIESYSKKINDLMVDEIIAKAFKIWADNSGLVVKQKSCVFGVDIKIGFYSKNHGDGYPFNGAGGTLGHAFELPHGLVHFDDDEEWTVNQTDPYQTEVYLLPVAVHEIGHALGLRHNEFNDSIMYKYYDGSHFNQSLSEYDVNSIQLLYGPPDICNISRIDGIVSRPDLEFTVYFNNKCFKINKCGSMMQPPQNVPDSLSNIKGEIKSTYFESEAIYFFTKQEVYKYSWPKYSATFGPLENGYPKKIHGYFKKGPKTIDAITLDPKSGNILIFNKRKYWLVTNATAVNPYETIERGVIPLNTSIIAADIDREGNYRLFGKKYYYQAKSFEDIKKNFFIKRKIERWFKNC